MFFAVRQVMSPYLELHFVSNLLLNFLCSVGSTNFLNSLVLINTSFLFKKNTCNVTSFFLSLRDVSFE